MSEFSIKFNSKALEQALANVNAVVSTSNAPTGKNFLLEVKDKKLSLIAFSSDTFVRLSVDAQTKGEGVFAFLPERMQGVIKGRSDMVFEYSGADCKFRMADKGRYSGTFVTAALAHDHESVYNSFMKKLRSNSEANTLKPAVMQSIRDGLKLTRLKDVYSDKPLISYIDLKDGTLSITTLDANHFALFKVAVKTKQEFRLGLPMTHFNVIDRVIEEDSSAVFDASSSHLRIQSGLAAMILPATQTDPSQFDIVPEFFAELKKPVFSAICTQIELQTLMDNMFTLYTQESRMCLSHKGESGLMKVTISTSNGSAEDGVKMKLQTGGPFTEFVDPRLLKDSLQLLKGQDKVKVAIIKGRAILLTCGSKDAGSVSIVTSVSE